MKKKLQFLCFLFSVLCLLNACSDPDPDMDIDPMPNIDMDIIPDPNTGMDTVPNPDPMPTTLLAVPGDYTTIQSALDDAEAGDTIVVAPGTYAESIEISLSDVLVTSQFYLEQDLSTIESTIIKGQGKAVVTFTASTTENTILQGFTLTGGEGNQYTRPNGVIAGGGGGIQGLNASPVVRFNIIENNEAVITGANNYAGGGGIRFEEGKPQITNNIIRNNKGNFAGGIFLDNTSALVQNNVIDANEALISDFAGGGGLYLDYSGSEGNKVINNTIVNNKSAGQAGGFVVAGNTGYRNLVFENNIIHKNENENIFARNGLTLSGFNPKYCMIEGSLTIGEEIISEAPRFVSDRFTLSDSSPCIDAGNPDASYNDYRGADSPTQGTERNDIGAYGGPQARKL